jgi:hypothetical protein
MQAVAVAAGINQRQQDFRRHRITWPLIRVNDRAGESAKPTGHPTRQYPLELEQRRQCRLVAAQHSTLGCFLQRDRHGQSFVVGQVQRRQSAARNHAVTTPWPRIRFDPIPKIPQPGHVPSHGALIDRHAFGKLTVCPRRPCGQQGQQPQ